MLAPGGKVAIQAITIAHDRLLATRTSYTWVHKYIFPGGFIPSVRAIEDVTEKQTRLRVRERLAMGDHYAQTLRLWEERFMARADGGARLGFDGVPAHVAVLPVLLRGRLRTGYLDVQQIVLDTRPAKARLPPASAKPVGLGRSTFHHTGALTKRSGPLCGVRRHRTAPRRADTPSTARHAGVKCG